MKELYPHFPTVPVADVSCGAAGTRGKGRELHAAGTEIPKCF